MWCFDKWKRCCNDDSVWMLMMMVLSGCGDACDGWSLMIAEVVVVMVRGCQRVVSKTEE